MIAGPSQCGKTTFTKQLLMQANSLPMTGLFEVEFVEGIPEDIPSLFPPPCRPGILVLDDLMRHCSEDERVLDLFTKVSQHCDVTCIYFSHPEISRSILLNAHYFIAFNNPRDTLGFRTLAQEAFAGQLPYVSESFQDCNDASVWLPDAGLASAYPKHTTTARKDIANGKALFRGLRQQVNT